MIVGDAEIEETVRSLKLLGTHQEHHTRIFPLLHSNIDRSGPLEQKVVFDLLIGEVGDSNSLEVVLKCLLVVLDCDIAVSKLYVGREPCLIQGNQVTILLNCRFKVFANLRAAGEASLVLERFLIADVMETAHCEIVQILIQQVLGQLQVNLVLFFTTQTLSLKCNLTRHFVLRVLGRLNKVRGCRLI